jgi:hypothetical protein
VWAVDPYVEMLEETERAARARVPGGDQRLVLHCARIEEFASSLPPASFEVVHAGFVLPFVESNSFARSFRCIAESLRVGGLFVGQFFGPDDEFIRTSSAGAMTSHTAEEVAGLLRDNAMTELHREEVRRDGHIGRGVPKFWHVHHVIARRT